MVTDNESRAKYAEMVEKLKNDAKLTNVVLCLDSADGPKGYGINAEAKVTVLVSSRLQVVRNFVFMDEKSIDAAAIVAALKEKLGTQAKK